MDNNGRGDDCRDNDNNIVFELLYMDVRIMVPMVMVLMAYPVLAIPNNATYTVCSDNDTLLYHDASYLNGTLNYTDRYTLCFYGCDNVTMSCNPPMFMENLLALGVVLFIVGGLVLTYKLVK
jgi:hypothetical protein